MTFKQAVLNTPVETRTENGMKTFESSLSPIVDFFFRVGSVRAMNRWTPADVRSSALDQYFEKAYHADSELALRVLLWARDIRGGAGERAAVRSVLQYIEQHYPLIFETTLLLDKIPEVGRWDDLLVFKTARIRDRAFRLIKEALDNGNGLAAKWMPRQGETAIALRTYMGLSPKKYRKLLVNLTRVVETQMCNKQWGDIQYSSVPSVAMSRYGRAFGRHDNERFVSYLENVKKGTAKINTGAVYPYDVLRTCKAGQNELADRMWDALPNYVGDASILPLVDVSGSMHTSVSGSIMAIDVAISLGMYCADKNRGAFKDLFLTFSAQPQFVHLKGSLSARMRQMESSNWGMNTNLNSAFDSILDVAVRNNVPASDMPGTLMIFSDMEFDACVHYDDSAIEMIRRRYAAAGYTVPQIVFWNINGRTEQVPVRFDEKGTALVSGFSPKMIETILSCDPALFNPLNIVLAAVEIDRYRV